MKTAIIFIIMGMLSMAGGINLAILALNGGEAVLWLTAGGSIAAGITCVISGYSWFDGWAK